MDTEKHLCIVCQKNSNEIPLLSIEFQGQNYWICPQHFPILIHQPDKLVGKLPGAEHLAPGQHD